MYWWWWWRWCWWCTWRNEKTYIYWICSFFGKNLGWSNKNQRNTWKLQPMIVGWRLYFVLNFVAMCGIWSNPRVSDNNILFVSRNKISQKHLNKSRTYPIADFSQYLFSNNSSKCWSKLLVSIVSNISFGVHFMGWNYVCHLRGTPFQSNAFEHAMVWPALLDPSTKKSNR